MIKIISTVITILSLTLTSCSTIKPYSGPIIHGGDYMATNVGDTYTYERKVLGSSDTSTLKITVNSCNKDKTQCSYENKLTNDKGKTILAYTSKYNDAPDGISLTDKAYPNSTLLLPAKLELNEEMLIHNDMHYDKISDSTATKLIVIKLIPEITVNHKKYNDCIKVIFNSEVELPSKYARLVTGEVMCRGIGNVKKEVGIYYHKRTDMDVNDGAYQLESVYTDKLVSITHTKTN